MHAHLGRTRQTQEESLTQVRHGGSVAGQDVNPRQRSTGSTARNLVDARYFPCMLSHQLDQRPHMLPCKGMRMHVMSGGSAARTVPATTCMAATP